jgi:hypothetical protein
MFPHVPQLDSSVLATAEEFVGVVGKAERHDRFLMGFEAVDHLGFIEDPDHAVLKGSDQQVAVGGDSTWTGQYLLVEICPSAWNWMVLAVFWV